MARPPAVEPLTRRGTRLFTSQTSGILPRARCVRRGFLTARRFLIPRVVVLRAIAGALEHPVWADEVDAVIAAE